MKINFLFYHLNAHRTRHTGYYLPKVQIKDYDVMIDRQNIFDQPVKNDLRTYDNIRKITIGQGDHYTTDYLLVYPYCKEKYKLTAIDLTKQQTLGADTKAIQQNNFTRNLAQD